MTSRLHARRAVRRRRARAILAAVAIAVPVSLAAPSFGATSTGVPGTPTAVQAAQAGAGPDVAVSWTPAPSGPAATGATVALYDVTGSSPVSAAVVSCRDNCTSVDLRQLADGHRYEALVWASNASGAGAPAVSSVATPVDGCATGACVDLDATQTLGPADRAGQGFLHSVYPAGSDQADLAQLGPTMYRGAPASTASGLDWTSWDVAQAAGAQTTLILSDLWLSGGGGATPWSDWSAYSSWVTRTVQSIVGSGHRVTYWEPFNEPGMAGYYSSANFATVTPALLLKQFKVTYQAIRRAQPSAAIIGPSLATWSDAPQTPSAADRAFDMVSFLDYAATNHLTLAAISWHDIGDSPGDYPGENTVSPQNLIDEVNEARQLIAALPALGQPKIFINEYEMPEVYGIPGWDVAYLAALTDARVDSTALSCWSNCYLPSLDGLLSADGTQTMPDYWVRSKYAGMTGQMISTSSTDDGVAAVAAYDSSASQVTALIGRGQGCSQNGWCAAAWPNAKVAAPEPVTVQIKVPWSSGSVALSEDDVPGQQLAALSWADATAAQQLPISFAGDGTGTVTVTIPSFADGDAYAFTLSRS